MRVVYAECMNLFYGITFLNSLVLTIQCVNQQPKQYKKLHKTFTILYLQVMCCLLFIDNFQDTLIKRRYFETGVSK